MTVTEYTTIKLPTIFVHQIDKFVEEHRHEGFHTRPEVIRTAVREFFGNYNGGNNNFSNPDLSNKKKMENEEKDV